MLAHVDSLLDELVKVLRDLGTKTVGLEDTDNFATGDGTDLTNSLAVTENNTDLRRRQSLTSKLADVIIDLLSRSLEPRGGSALVRDAPSGDTLSTTIHTTHLE